MNLIQALKENEKPFGLMSKEMQDKARELQACKDRALEYIFQYWSDCWLEASTPCFDSHYTHRLRPDYKEDSETLDGISVLGREVKVYDRYHFALPLKGCIQEVSSKDGAYKVRLYPDQHGFPNYMIMSETYFHHQQCELQDVKEGSKERNKEYCCQIDCKKDAEWVIWADGVEDTMACTEHVGELLTDAKEHRIFRIEAD